MENQTQFRRVGDGKACRLLICFAVGIGGTLSDSKENTLGSGVSEFSLRIENQGIALKSQSKTDL